MIANQNHELFRTEKFGVKICMVSRGRLFCTLMYDLLKGNGFIWILKLFLQFHTFIPYVEPSKASPSNKQEVGSST